MSSVSNKADKEVWDEGRLVSCLKERQEEAFRVLIRRYQGKLFSIAYGITLDREESLDIVQEVFLKVYEKIHTFREESRLSTWLHRITVNQCLNWKRRWKRRFRWHHQPLERDDAGDLPELGTDADYPETLYQKKEFARIFWQRLKELPEEARTVFVLKEVEGLSYDEIARVLKIKRGTVSSRLFYARKRLRESLKPYLEEEEHS
jgi:RNA polymerase sigma-70 factor (ECF subfamily)